MMVLHNAIPSDDQFDKLNHIELILDSTLEDGVLDEMSLSREIHEAWFSHGVRKFPLHLTCSDVNVTFGPSLERSNNQELLQNLCGLDLIHANIVEGDVARLLRVAPNLRELHFCAQTFVGTFNILQTLRNKLNDDNTEEKRSLPTHRFDCLAIVRHVAMEKKFMQLIADFMSNLFAQEKLRDMELCWCGGGGTMKLLVDSILTQQQQRQQQQRRQQQRRQQQQQQEQEQEQEQEQQHKDETEENVLKGTTLDQPMTEDSQKFSTLNQTMTLCYSGCDDVGSARSIPDWTRLVQGLNPNVKLKLTLQEIPMLLNPADLCSFSCASSPISEFFNALQQRPPDRFCVGNVGLDSDGVEILCLGLGRHMEGEFGVWDEGLLEGVCFSKLMACIPQMTVKNLALQDTRPDCGPWTMGQKRSFLSAIERNVTLNNVDYHIGPVLGEGVSDAENIDPTNHNSSEKDRSDMVQSELERIFRRNKCINFVRKNLGNDIPHNLFPYVLERFGNQDYSPTLAYLFWVSQIGRF